MPPAQRLPSGRVAGVGLGVQCMRGSVVGGELDRAAAYGVDVAVAQAAGDPALRPGAPTVMESQHPLPCSSVGACAACGGGTTLGVGHHVLAHTQVAAIAPREDCVAHIRSQLRQALMPVFRCAAGIRIRGHLDQLPSRGGPAEVVEEKRLDTSTNRALKIWALNDGVSIRHRSADTWRYAIALA